MPRKGGHKDSSADSAEESHLTEDQSNEIEALRSIYEEHLEELTPTDEQTSHLLKIRILPFYGGSDENHSAVDLLVSFDFDYPEYAPGIELDNERGISDAEKEALFQMLRKESQELRGEAMVFRLVDLAQSFLRDHNRKPKSFYEEMMERQQEMKARAREKEDAEESAEDDSRDIWNEGKSQEIAEDAFRERRNEVVRLREKKEEEKERKRRVQIEDVAAAETLTRSSSGITTDGSSNQGEGERPHQLMLIHLLHQYCRQSGGPESYGNLVQQMHRLGILGPASMHLARDERFFQKEFNHIFAPFMNALDTQDLMQARFWNLQAFESDTSPGQSRYRSDFEELEMLGKGSFGEVVKCRNKLDGRYYAIKKIRLDDVDQDLNRRMVREVMTLAKLHHPHIVRYYQAWIEGGDDSSSYEGTETDDWISGSVSSALGQSRSGQFDLRSDSMYGGQYAESNSLSRSPGYEQSTIDEDSTPNYNVGAGNRPPSFLYIQMEYCEKRTLRTAIHGCKMNDTTTIWRLFRQILEALTHIHAKGVIHRDLKPANIFFDECGDIKMGDFGLATDMKGAILTEQGSFQLSEDSGSRPHSGRDDDDDDDDDSCSPTVSNASDDDEPTRTAGVGTALYAAPEQEKIGERYDEKVDMFSLGIIFFEMWHLFQTAHERIMVLGDLRERLIFPDGFETSYPRQSKIVRWLLEPNASSRPTAVSLLQSDLLPPKMEDEYLKDTLRAVSNPHSTFYPRVLEAMFSNAGSRQRSIVGVHNEKSGGVQPPLEVLVMERVQEQCLNVFKRHGAVPMKTKVVTLSSLDGFDDEHSDAATLLDPSGAKVVLQYDNRVQFARHLASWQSLPSNDFKRYDLSQIFRTSTTVGSSPREFFHADFDVVGASYNSMAVAEVVSVVCEVLEEFPQIPRYYVRINHLTLSQAIFEALHIKGDEVRMRISAILLQHVRLPWTKIRSRLVQENLLTARHADQLGKYVTLKGEFDQMMTKLKDMLGSNPKFCEASQHLEEVVRYAGVMGVPKDHFSLDLSLMPREQYYSDVVFQVLLKDPSSTKSAECIAMGGRYDELVRDLRPRKNPSNLGLAVVGVSFAIERIIQQLVEIARQSSGVTNNLHNPFNDRDRDIFVCSVGEAVFEERIRLTSALRRAGNSAECIYSEDDSLEMQVEVASGKGINWLVIIKDHTYPEKVRIKNALFKVDTDCAGTADDLVKYFGFLLTAPRQRVRGTSKNVLGVDVVPPRTPR